MNMRTEQTVEPITRTFIVEAIRDIMSDPDFGLELTEQAKHRLKLAKTSKKKNKPLSQIKREYR